MFKWFDRFKRVVKKETIRIVSVKGEQRPGFIDVDLATFDEFGNHVPYPTISKTIKIDPKIRPTINRILAGTETQDDLNVLEARLSKEV